MSAVKFNLQKKPEKRLVSSFGEVEEAPKKPKIDYVSEVVGSRVGGS